MKIVGFNGPPGSGKDTLAAMLYAHVGSQGVPYSLIEEESLSLPLREIAYKIVGYKGDLDGPEYAAFKVKTFPIGFAGTTGRQLMIDTSERFLKPCYGQTVMADMLASRHPYPQDHVLLVRDCGFQCEVQPLIDWVGESNFYLVNVMRPDTDFSNDSREWVNHPNSRMQMQVNNAGSLDDLRVEAGRIYGRLVNQLGWIL